MIRRMNSKRVVKAISIGLSVYMVLSPVVVYAGELSAAENALTAQIEARDESASRVEAAVENAVVSEQQTAFENMEIVAGVEASDSNALEDTTVLVEEEINRIENEAIKEATEAIIHVDMSDVDEALNKVTELVDSTLTDETVAVEIEATADALISIYDAQATAALNALMVISEEMDAVTVSEDGTVAVDWTAASEEVEGLYKAYQEALAAKESAQTAKDEAAEKKSAASDKLNELNNGKINDNKEISEVISASKLNKSNEINDLIASVAELKSKDIVNGYTYDYKIDGSSDMYRFYINKVEDGIAYGCLTYYDSASKTILRKNFKISGDDIDCNYIPKAEWVKEDKDCKEVVFGNGGNYIAAYVENISKYLDRNKNFKGGDVSDIMRANLELNNAIDVRNQTLIDLAEINKVLDQAEEELKDASDKADDALSAYQDAVALYKEAAELDGEIKNSEIEKAKLEYVKAEVEVWRRQQVLKQIEKTVRRAEENSGEAVDVDSPANIETVVSNIADHLGVEPESVEELVAQVIIDTENHYYASASHTEEYDVLDVSRNEMAEETMNAKSVASETLGEQATKEVVTIEDEELPLASGANVVAEAGNSMNLWFVIMMALTCAVIILFVVRKKNQKEEEISR